MLDIKIYSETAIEALDFKKELKDIMDYGPSLESIEKAQKEIRKVAENYFTRLSEEETYKVYENQNAFNQAAKERIAAIVEGVN